MNVLEIVTDVGTEKTQMVLVAALLHVIEHTMNHELLTDKSKLILARALRDQLVGKMPVDSRTTMEELMGTMPIPAKLDDKLAESAAKLDEKKNEEALLKTFNDTMEETIKATKEGVEVTDQLQKLVALIDSYTGEVPVLKSVRDLLNTKRFPEDKLTVVKDFIKTIV